MTREWFMAEISKHSKLTCEEKARGEVEAGGVPVCHNINFIVSSNSRLQAMPRWKLQFRTAVLGPRRPTFLHQSPSSLPRCRTSEFRPKVATIGSQEACVSALHTKKLTRSQTEFWRCRVFLQLYCRLASASHCWLPPLCHEATPRGAYAPSPPG